MYVEVIDWTMVELGYASLLPPEEGPWRRTRKGSLTRTVGRTRQTVFLKGWYFRWCVSSTTGVRYSPDHFPTEEEAIEDLVRELKEQGDECEEDRARDCYGATASPRSP